MIVDFLHSNNRLVEASTTAVLTPELSVVRSAIAAVEEYYNEDIQDHEFDSDYEFKSLLTCRCLKKLAKNFYLWMREIPNPSRNQDQAWVDSDIRDCPISVARELYFSDNPKSISFSANTTTVVVDSLELIIGTCWYLGPCYLASYSPDFITRHVSHNQRLDSNTDLTYDISFDTIQHEFVFTLHLNDGAKITLDLPPCKLIKGTYIDPQFVQALDKAIAMKFLKNEQAIISEGSAFIADTCLNILDE